MRPRRRTSGRRKPAGELGRTHGEGTSSRTPTTEEEFIQRSHGASGGFTLLLELAGHLLAGHRDRDMQLFALAVNSSYPHACIVQGTKEIMELEVVAS